MNSKKCLVAVFAGAVVVFVWLNISWMVLQLHGIKQVENEAATGAALKAAATEDGVYAIPAWEDADGKMLDPDVMAEKAKEGPFAFMVILPNGKEMIMLKSMITGFFIQIIGALILCFLMLLVSGGGGGDFKRRAIAGVCFALAVGLMPALSNWNWWHFPIGYTIASVLDGLVSWSLAGLVMAKILQPKDSAVAAA